MPSKVVIDTKGLDALVKAFRDDLPTANVGILGSSASRDGGGPSNADVGAAHEFGTASLPQRSFLRMPLTEKLAQYLETSGAFNKDVLAKVIAEHSIRPWMTKVALIAENVIADAFATGGFGKWRGWKRKSYTNNTGMILVDTTQLAKSVTSEVK